jgi:signal transduction histidine kinase
MLRDWIKSRLENAIKYSLPGSEIRVSIEPYSDYCMISVSSTSEGQRFLDENIFLRGVRGSFDKEGSGNGLYVAQLVAKQHRAKIVVQSKALSLNQVRHIFSIHFEVI